MVLVLAHAALAALVGAGAALAVLVEAGTGSWPWAQHGLWQQAQLRTEWHQYAGIHRSGLLADLGGV